MPRGDRTGPMGMGPMTGRAAGYCAGYSTPGFANPVAGRGLGRGAGFYGRGAGGGHGWRNMFYATGMPGWMRYGGYPATYGYGVPNPDLDPGSAKDMLNNQAQFLQKELEAVQKKLAELEKDVDK